MRKSKIIAGISVLVLTIAAGLWAKANHKVHYYYYLSGTGGCKPVIVEFYCQPGGINCVFPVGNGPQPKQLFSTQLSAAVCRTTLKPS